MSNGGNERPPLANVDAEAGLLGALMIDNRLIDRVRAIIDPNMFSEAMHGRIYKAICKFTEAGKVANPITLRPIFESDPVMNQVGGPSYMAQLTGSGAAVIGAMDFAQQVRDLFHLRNLRDTIETAVTDLYDTASFEDVVASVEIATGRASMSMRDVEMLTTEQMLDLTTNRADKSLESGVPGASCKLISDNDTLLGRLEPGQMTITAGRPGMGKSTWAVSSALGYAINGHPGLYALAESSAEMFSLKMTADLLHAAGRPVLFKTLKEGILSREERNDLERAREVAKMLPIKWAHVGRTDIKRLEALVARESMRLKREGKRLEWFVVDYLQLLTAEGRHKMGDSVGRVNAVSEGILNIAQKYETHAIALSQLSRNVESRDDKRPRLSDLRESGRLEEDADNVMMVFREEYYLEKMKPSQEGKEMEAWVIDMGHARGKIELIAAKTRFGANAARKAIFLGDHSAVRGSNWHSMAVHDDDELDLFERFGA